MKRNLILAMIASSAFYGVCADGVSVLLEQKIDRLIKIADSVPDTMKPDIICASALGYLSSGNLSKAKSCHKLLSECKGDNVRFLEIFTNGVLRTSCAACKGDGLLKRNCARCEGKGKAEIMKGTVGKCLICSGLGRVGGKCADCDGKGCIEFTPEICASICLSMISNLADGVRNSGDAWEDLLIRSSSGAAPDESEFVMGVPRSVFLKIKAKAEADWPDDYGMQKYRIENEVRDYKDLKSIR